MKKSRKSGSEQRRIGAFVYVRADGDEQYLDDQETFLRRQCDKEKFEVLCVLREVDVPTIVEAIKVAFKRKNEVKLLVSVDVALRTYWTWRGIREQGKRFAIGRSWRLDDIKELSSFDPTEEILALMNFTTVMKQNSEEINENVHAFSARTR
ncbi:MAG: hypothetical protein WC798_02840 [Candidatus Paceibacterota bacterium]|jgi:hypothetical protein